jgi:7,8-dihydropterin-6-yl-methyl-4-(beta-D-ribofuranosyl)aminobenzene 5'-phosphate synthase
MSIQITILCENTVGPSLFTLGEHGFAAFLETPAGNYLFDTGQGTTILRNAKHLKKNLDSLQKIFLSHGHYDHTGGLQHVLKIKNPLEVCAHPRIFDKKYARVKNNGKTKENYIGMRHTKQYYEKRGANFTFNRHFTEVRENIYLTGEIPRITAYEKGDERLSIHDNGQVIPDPLYDDQALVVRTQQGLTIVLGCAHSGLINTIEYVLDHLTGEQLHAIIGGTHLGFLTDDQLNSTISDLRHHDFHMLGMSHCTGLKAGARLYQEFKEQCLFATAGTSFNID